MVIDIQRDLQKNVSIKYKIHLITLRIHYSLEINIYLNFMKLSKRPNPHPLVRPFSPEFSFKHHY